MRSISLHIFLVLFAFSSVAFADDADEVREKGIAALKDSQTNPHAIVDAARFFVKAAALYNSAGNEEMNVEMNSFLYWCKKKMTMADIEQFTKGGEEGVARKLAAVEKAAPKADDAQKWFDRADQFAKKNPDEHLLIAIRFFEVADRFKGSDASFAAQDRSLKEQLADKNSAVKTAVPPATIKPTETSVNPIEMRPIPGADDIKMAEKFIKDLLKADYAKTDAPSRMALVAKLLQQAEENKNDAASYYVLLHEARDQAVLAGDCVKATEAQHQLREAFKMDFAAMLLDLRKLEPSTKTAEPAAALATLFSLAADDALAVENYDQAVRFNAHADDLLPLIKDAALKTRLKAEIPRVQSIKRESVAALAAQKTLATKPDDAEANLTAGKFALLIGNFEKSMALLAKCKDATLSGLAKRELAPPQVTAEQAQLADGWFDRAEKEASAILKTRMQDRAAFWYTTALPGLTGLMKLKVEGRIKGLPQSGAVGMVAPISTETTRQPSMAKIDPKKELVLDLGAGVKMELIYIPAGSFVMGCPAKEKGNNGDTKQHSVTLTKPFFMGKYTVTQEQYEAIMGENPSMFKHANYPVNFTSWTDAQKFCDKLNERAKDKLPPGYNLQLPTEAQYEYAARAGTKTRFPTGDEDTELDSIAWYGPISAGETHAVGTKKPNAWGLYDMHGNVYQWVQDWYDHGYATTAQTDPKGPATGTLRVGRGGAYDTVPDNCRSAKRSAWGEDMRSPSIGFRVAMVFDSETQKLGYEVSGPPIGRWISKDATYKLSSIAPDMPIPSPNLLNGKGGGYHNDGGPDDFAFSTDNDDDPWIVIDLKAVYDLQTIQIITRRSLLERAAPMIIYRGASAKGPWTEMWRTDERKAEYQVSISGKAQFIKILRTGKNFLNMFSIKVYAK